MHGVNLAQDRYATIVIRYFVMPTDVESGRASHKAWRSKARADTFFFFLTTLQALHNFPCGHFHPQQCDVVCSHLRQRLNNASVLHYAVAGTEKQ